VGLVEDAPAGGEQYLQAAPADDIRRRQAEPVAERPVDRQEDTILRGAGQAAGRVIKNANGPG